MVHWLVENKELIFFGHAVFILATIYHATHGQERTVGKAAGHSPSLDKVPLFPVEEVFGQLRDALPHSQGDISNGLIGTRVKATGRVHSVRKLTGDLMTISIRPHGVEEGYVSTGVPFSEFREIVESDQDITMEGQISYIDLHHTQELCLSDAKLSLTA